MLDVGKMVDAVLDAIDKPMRAMHDRVKALETCALPPELVAQLATAAEILAEPMPELRADAAPVASAPPQETPRSVIGAVITRTGELALSYSDGSSERLGFVIGPPGEAGPQGAPGRDGAKGEEGPPGRDGVGIAAYAINRKGELMITGTDGTVHTPGRIGGDEKPAAA